MPRVAAIQMTSSANISENLQNVKLLIQQAKNEGATLVALPEMFAIFGVTPIKQLKAREKFGQGPIQDFLAQQSLENKIWIVGGTIPLEGNTPSKSLAASLVFNDKGKCVAQYNKIHLFDVIAKENEEYKESATTEPGNHITVIDTPIGKLGLAICYDVRFPELFKLLLNKGAEIIILPSAFTVPTGQAHWKTLVTARAIDTFCYIVAPAQVGTHANGRQTYGHSMIVAPSGKILEELPEKTGIITAEIYLTAVHEIRQRIPILQHQRIQFDDSTLAMKK